MYWTMLTEKDYCDYDTCVALKELGFNERCLGWYDEERTLNHNRKVLWANTHIENYNAIACPSLYEAQKWLREEKRILILPDYNSFGWFCGIHYPINSVKMFKYTAKEVNSYEEALLEGIKEAIKILMEEK